METNTSSIVPAQPIVLPAVTSNEALKAWDLYEDLKKKIVTESDVQKIGGKNFLKKSYWRKAARFFNLNIELVEERKEDLGEGKFAYHFKARATAPNGAFAEGTGSCDNSEKGISKSIHNTRTTAETRAWNRAVSNLIGAGEVSAEEIYPEEIEKDTFPPTREEQDKALNGEKNKVTKQEVEQTFEDKSEPQADAYSIKNPNEKATTQQIKKIYAIFYSKKLDKEQFQEHIKKLFNKTLNELTKFEASTLIEQTIKDGWVL
ncbi:hypothetical protein A3J90_08410 [candidate division WOR-1 bacterium RIFOXYC2_FULL_37_10]|uniref:Uncharacterized protein n=1 Tax=candidate division WOR-1 bacterium RIFOXYB2_FULL_37_13 TaxID=1802579 RepID=A0A1F4SV22_UNCSA|nr:MAG: hypothetical protein A2246_01510 [candidate division WOR-1 bacterium RIFOXYA2_FULL_37_7]OGC24284.1 MAG: hypothetical protein A2310_08150 [candidate division WOR-1 bacterium RIFOXYB2_FULL_37_13]OGC36387.1 MAG: hypothetical protein A3J90_08410 [candidate division WOR-1 bacterium RIFOXYC2_FULL_37_10]